MASPFENPNLDELDNVEDDVEPVVEPEAPVDTFQVPQVAIKLADEYAADSPVEVGFGGYELTLTPSPVEVDQSIADQLLESPVVEKAD